MDHEKVLDDVKKHDVRIVLIPTSVESAAIIKARASLHNICCHTRGRSSILYVECPLEMWESFLDEIKSLCRVEDIPAPPHHIQKQMLGTLCRTTLNKYDPVRAERAAQLLDQMARDSEDKKEIDSKVETDES